MEKKKERGCFTCNKCMRSMRRTWSTLYSQKAAPWGGNYKKKQHLATFTGSGTWSRAINKVMCLEKKKKHFFKRLSTSQIYPPGLHLLLSDQKSQPGRPLLHTQRRAIKTGCVRFVLRVSVCTNTQIVCGCASVFIQVVVTSFISERLLTYLKYVYVVF